MIKQNLKPRPTFIQTREIIEEPRKAFAHVPHSLRNWKFIDENEPAQGVYLHIGDLHPCTLRLSLGQFAATVLLVQLGMRAYTNANNNRKTARYYPKFSMPAYGEAIERFTLSRFFWGASMYTAIRTKRDPHDLRFANLYAVSAGRADKNARKVILRHAELLATQSELEGRLPEGISADAYIENLQDFLSLLDAERAEALLETEAVLKAAA
ncbi:MAG TPA: hypothetical protein VG519_02715 [Pseudochrobactrum sp.]|nr:hypothetical protein [Pseudochrobactrum sp.]